MPDLEFTGERVVPGLVEPDLLNEHLVRYRFAALFAENGRILDAGCGAGYGAAELAPTASCVVAMDIAAEAVAHARGSFAGPRTAFLRGSCERLPFADHSFDLIVAFEVIEHLPGWRDLLAEALRVLSPSGVLLVSTPNKAFYSESRAAAGPNPFHVHEFEYHEFQAALAEIFPHVHLWSQNHSEVISLVSGDASAGILDAAPDTSPEQAHFFLAACSRSPIPLRAAFAWLPASGNVLRERQHHIALLKGEISRKDAWLAEAAQAHTGLQREYDRLAAELNERTAWAEHLNQEIERARAVIESQRDEMQGYARHLARLEAESAERLEWVRRLEPQLAERTAWALSLAAEQERERAAFRSIEGQHYEVSVYAQATAEKLEAAQQQLLNAQGELAAVETTKWVRLGRALRAMRDKTRKKAAALERSDK